MNLFKEKEDGWSLRKHIIWRLKNNVAWTGAIVGERGSGKSWASLSLCWGCAEEDEKRFNSSHICFDIPNMIKKIDEGVPKGSMFLLDEIGISAPAREFRSLQNKLAGYILQSSRALSVGICYNSVSVGFYDINLRKLMVNVIMMLEKTYRGYGYCVVRFVEVNPLTGEIKYPFPVNHGVSVRPMYEIGERHNFYIPSPPEKLAREYEEKKSKWLKNLVSEFNIKLEQESGGHTRFAYSKIEEFLKSHPEILSLKNRKDCARLCYYEIVKEGLIDKYKGINRKVVEDVIAVNFLHKEKKLREPEYLKTLYEKLGSYRKVSDAVGYSHSYVRNVIREKENGI